MGWYTSYQISLYQEIGNFDYAQVDCWCSEQENYTSIEYRRRQYKDPLVVYVEIKYGKHEIECVLDYLNERYNCGGDVFVESTNEHEWPDWRRYYSGCIGLEY